MAGGFTGPGPTVGSTTAYSSYEAEYTEELKPASEDAEELKDIDAEYADDDDEADAPPTAARTRSLRKTARRSSPARRT